MPTVLAEKMDRDTGVAAEFPGMEPAELRRISDEGRVAIFYRGFCYATFSRRDRFARNVCLVQLHEAGRVKLEILSRLFGISYQQCSNVLVRYGREGMNGLRDDREGYSNREKITEERGRKILEWRKQGKTYPEISQIIRLRWKEKILPGSLCSWVYRERKAREAGATGKPIQLEMESAREEEEGIEGGSEVSGTENSYAGSMVLYGMIEGSRWLEPFETQVVQEEEKRKSAWSVRRVLLTLFFLHALRFKSIEQTKHLVASHFRQIVGGDFLTLQGLRYAVDEVVSAEGFDRAMEEHYRNLLAQTDRGDARMYADGHFSRYYGSRKVPKGYDPRRQMGCRGRNTIFLHNSLGENMYLFESPTNTSLATDLETLITDVTKRGFSVAGKTIGFDRGGYSNQCFRFLKGKGMYFTTYLKYRTKERCIEEARFEAREVEGENGETEIYWVYEGETRWTSYGKVRVIVLLDEGRQIPILTNHPTMKAEDVIAFLARRWREENCFKYMIEHFGLDLLTTYKTEAAPDKVIARAHPERKEINRLIAKQKNEVAHLQSQLAQKLEARGEQDESLRVFHEQEKELCFAIKNAQVDLDVLKRKRENIPTKEKRNLRDDHVIIAQKRRLLINAIKAMNYNVEKRLQETLKTHHGKKDETLSILRRLWQQPGRVLSTSASVRVELVPLNSKSMRESVTKLLDNLKENNLLRMPDGRKLEIHQAA